MKTRASISLKKLNMKNYLFTLLALITLAKSPYVIASEDKMCDFRDVQISDNIKSYLSNIKKIAVEFEQTDSRGSKATGILLIDKPYKFRCNYYQPFPLLIIGNKNYVSVYDYEMEHFARIKTTENIFNFLLLDKIELGKQFQITAQKEYEDILELSLYHEESGRTSNIAFDKISDQIKNIIIYEDDNIITLKFSQTRNLSQISRELFIIQDPEIFGKPERLTQKDIEKLIK